MFKNKLDNQFIPQRESNHSTAKNDFLIKDNNFTNPPKTKSKFKIKFKWPPNKKEWAISASIIIFGAIIIAYFINHSGPKPVVNATASHPRVKVPPKPTIVPSTLSGLPVDPSVNNTPVTGVMIENSIYARPQSGLGQAGVVFEAIAEGGITRFLALFQDTAPGSLGPIRSVRPYYEQWALGFDASLAHVGGSPEALADMKAWHVKDLDQFSSSGSYTRISSRSAPHNVYTSVSRLNTLEAAKGFNTVNFKGFVRKKALPLKTPTNVNIDISISGPLYAVHYSYDPKTNTYLRNEAGSPHIDANSNTQISPTVVIALVIPYSLEADHYHSDYGVIGSGQAYIFQDGGVTVGNWSKTSSATQITFTDQASKPIKLDPGQTWVTAISHSTDVKY